MALDYEKNTYLRLHQIVGDKKSIPPVDPLIPISASSWWAGVKIGRYPKPIKLSARTTVWRLADIQELMATLSADGYKPTCGRIAKKATVQDITPDSDIRMNSMELGV